jgi:hypothetical protein
LTFLFSPHHPAPIRLCLINFKLGLLETFKLLGFSLHLALLGHIPHDTPCIARFCPIHHSPSLFFFSFVLLKSQEICTSTIIAAFC